MKPWKSIPSARRRQPPTALQWGHGDEAVEEKVRIDLEPLVRSLQWGHGDEAVEEGTILYGQVTIT